MMLHQKMPLGHTVNLERNRAASRYARVFWLEAVFCGFLLSSLYPILIFYFGEELLANPKEVGPMLGGGYVLLMVILTYRVWRAAGEYMRQGLSASLGWIGRVMAVSSTLTGGVLMVQLVAIIHLALLSVSSGPDTAFAALFAVLKALGFGQDGLEPGIWQ